MGARQEWWLWGGYQPLGCELLVHLVVLVEASGVKEAVGVVEHGVEDHQENHQLQHHPECFCTWQ